MSELWADMGPQLWPAFWVTLKLTFFSAIGALVWGTLLAAMRVSPLAAEAIAQPTACGYWVARLPEIEKNPYSLDEYMIGSWRPCSGSARLE